ncbi:hypothetical protein LC608_15580 [Nostoc sp. XA010]|uniref:hypothetical protein n=1 Tax=Nostoc sp. XA010 TaxID=2780407 RepID=UPI001E49EE84|nr:hypothetical protein [Nostoc sp. XA010]MCC5658384.1 hypothetical protein [Nostoc sp. XA010]
MRGGAPQAAIFISRAAKGTKLLGEAIALLSKTKEATVLKTVSHLKTSDRRYFWSSCNNLGFTWLSSSRVSAGV